MKEKGDVALREEEILDFWNQEDIFEKTLTKDAPKGQFTFYDGPPFATGLPHYGHLLASTIKDTVPRYKTMRGYHVPRRWGWDCHGLPIENIVEKKLGISGRKEIEEHGVAKFNEEARSTVLRFANEWKDTIERLGRWVDFQGSYKTMDNTFIESVWYALKSLADKDLLYEDRKVLPYCPRCETPIAQSEIAMDNSYKDIKDISIYVRFPLVGEKNTSFLVWTTTPWTLPGNVALAVGKGLTYAKVKVTHEEKEEIVILAEALVEEVLGEYTHDVLETFSGATLIGKEYEPPFTFYIDSLTEHDLHVYAGDFVTSDEGTGVVHIAPVFGEDDYALKKMHDLSEVRHVTEKGVFAPETGDLAGIAAKPKDDHQSGDVAILKLLAPSGKLFAKKKIEHSYPHCYRCDTPLYYYALPSWFINIQKHKDRLLAQNEKISWVPEHIKHGRFKKSMEGAPDWNISRNRFWASPIPIWKSDDDEKIVIGSLEELKRHTKTSGNSYFVMRHGEGEHNAQHVVSAGVHDTYGLTDTGREQCATNATRLQKKNITRIYASPFVRTKESAECVAEALGYPKEDIVYDERLRELEFGTFDGKDFSEYSIYCDTHVHTYDHTLPEGESYQDAKNRFGEFLYELEKTQQNEQVLIITHGIGIQVLSAVLSGLDKKESLTLLRELNPAPGHLMQLDFVQLPHNGDYEIDFHRPYIDEVVLQKDGKEFHRIPEVFDCWFESGSMPYGQWHYPFENTEVFNPQGGFLRGRKGFPADFIAEYVAQTRTWFYYTHALASMLFNSPAFKNVVVTGTVLAEDGQKMSKSKENFPDPWDMLNTYGSDAVRFYMISSSLMRAEDMNFAEDGVKEVTQKVLGRLHNVYTFYDLYRGSVEETPGSEHVLDTWIHARLNELVREVTEHMEAYEIDRAARPLADFVDDLSTWYLRRSRDRIKNGGVEGAHALYTLREVLMTFAQTLAPFMPFYAEYLYRNVREESDPESVHLTRWPTSSTSNTLALTYMHQVRMLVSDLLQVRQKEGMRVRQPLASATVPRTEATASTAYQDIIKDEVNVEVIHLSDGQTVALDTELTPELVEQGEVRELLRAIQNARKDAGLEPGEKADLSVHTEDIHFIERHTDAIRQSADVENIHIKKETVAEGEGVRTGEGSTTIAVTHHA